MRVRAIVLVALFCIVAAAFAVPLRLDATAEPTPTPMPAAAPANDDRGPGQPDLLVPPLPPDEPAPVSTPEPGAPARASDVSADAFWRGEYFANRSLSGTPAFTRDDRSLQFDWGYGSPIPDVPAGEYSVRWRRTINIPRATSYRVYAIHDDGARVWIDDRLVYDQWSACCAWRSADVFLTAGDHSFRVEMWQGYGAGGIQMYLSPVAFSGWRGEYYNNDRFDNQPVWVRDDPGINFNWYGEPPAPNVNDDFAARWTRDVYLPSSGLYRLKFDHDDGVRVYIDDILRLDKWQSVGADTAEVNLERGSHRFRIELRDTGGWAGIKYTLEQPEVVCPSPLDLSLVLDGSGSITPADFNSIKQFSRNLVASFSVSPGSGHIGVVQFTDSVRVETELSDNPYHIINVIDNMGQMNGSTNIADGLRVGQSLIRQRGRAGVPHVIILLSDGGYNTGGDPVPAASGIKAEGTVIFAVAVGGAYINVLNGIASDPDSNYVFPVNDLNGLSGILRSLVATTCPPTPIPSPTPPPLQVNAAALDGQAVYPTVRAGGTVDYWVRVRNAGNTTWRAADGYGWRGYGQWAARPGGAVWRDVPPGDALTFQEQFTAPAAAGEYIYGFMLHQNGAEFGPYFFLKVTVTNPVLEGRVQAMTNTGPIYAQGAVVTDNTGRSVTTDANGGFSFGAVAPGSYQLTAFYNGYTFAPQAVRVQTDMNVTLLGQRVGIREIEVDQALGSVSGFVAGKQTALRVRFNFPVYAEPDRQYVEVRRDGALVARLTPAVPASRSADILTFNCPTLSACGRWQKGNYVFTANINGATYSRANVAFEETRSLRVLVVRVRVNAHGVIREPDLIPKDAADFLRQVFPVAENGLKWVVDPVVFDATSYDLERPGFCFLGQGMPVFKGQCNLVRDLQKRQLHNCNSAGGTACYDKIIGVIPAMAIDCEANGEGCLLGFVLNDVSTAAVVMADGVFRTPDGQSVVLSLFPAAIAHEVGHTFGLGDEYEGGRFQCSINPAPAGIIGREPTGGTETQCADASVTAWNPATRGVAVLTEPDRPYEIVPLSWAGPRGALPNMLGFMGSAETWSQNWVTRWEWNQLFKQFRLQAAATTVDVAEATAVRLVTISGVTQAAPPLPAETAAFDVAISFQGNAPAAGAGAYTMEALGASDQVLASRGFEISYLSWDNPPRVLDVAPFEVTLPYPANTVAFRLRHGDVILGRLPVSRNAPTVKVLAPTAGKTVGGWSAVRWQSADADGDALTHSVEYTHDGEQWLVVATGITGSETLIDFDALPGGPEARVRVIVTDGVNSAQAESGKFAVARKPPSVAITSPAPGARFVPGELVTLTAAAYDPQLGWLRDEAQLQWTSDRSGALGRGATLHLTNLPQGVHRITVTATTAGGQAVSPALQINIGAGIYLPLLTAPKPAAVSACGLPSLSNWYPTRPLPVASSRLWAAGRVLPVYKGELYLFGGHNLLDPRQVDIYAAALLPDGSLGPWRTAGALPGSFWDYTATIVGNRAYLFTGAAGNREVYVAPMRSDGYVGLWQETTLREPGSQNFALAHYGGRFYASGGNNGGSIDTVSFATIKGDGTLGGWTETTPLPFATEGHAMIAADGWLYALLPTRQTYRAAIRANGGIGVWRADVPLPARFSDLAVIQLNGVVYALDGATGAVFWAPLLPGGGLGAWQATSGLPAARRYPWLAAAGCQVYALGGQQGDEYYDSVYMTRLHPQ